MQLSLSAAAKEVDRPKSTLSRAIGEGRLSATRCENGSYQIDPAELYRVFPGPAPQPRSMSYGLQFLPSALKLKEWNKLGGTLRTQFGKKLAERLEAPRVQADALHGLGDHCKIKLRSLGYRLVCRVEDTAVTVTVVAAGKRERSVVCKMAERRARDEEGG